MGLINTAEGLGDGVGWGVGEGLGVGGGEGVVSLPVGGLRGPILNIKY